MHAVPGDSAGSPTSPAGGQAASITGRSAVAAAATTAGESRRAGTPWRIGRASRGGIEGFADRTSVAPGEPVHVFVSTTAATYVVRAFRMGWYAGVGGRLVWTSAPRPGRLQPGPVLAVAATRTWRAPWRPSVTLATKNWLPGDYLLRLDTSTRHSSFVPVTVRDTTALGRVVLLNAVTTWQAYNRWGCCDLYRGADGTFASRSRAVSFDRPYADEDGTGQFLRRELPVVVHAERLGLPLQYLTDVDLERDPRALDGARAVVSMGHDEYYSPAMRAALTSARDAGTNLAFFGANAVFRRIRLAATALGPNRLEINYKVAREDPLLGKNDAAVTSDWPAPPAANPESSLIGAQYGCFPGGARVAGVVAAPGSWILAGTAVSPGTRLPGLIGPELDAVRPRYPTPRPIEVVLHSPVNCPRGDPGFADATYYVARSGAGVFDAGTIDWPCASVGGCSAQGQTQAVVSKATDNVLAAFAAGPAGRVHPARDNLGALGIGP